MSKPPHSRFTIRRRILEVLMLLWVGAYLYNVFLQRRAAQPAQPVSAHTPAAAVTPKP
jgi:hypothetical protein